MTPDELFQAGRLAEALQVQSAEVKARPTDLDARFRLFVLLCFAGELERAGKHLDALGARDAKLAFGSATYHGLLAAEEERQRVFRGEARPLLPRACPEHAQARLDAVGALAAGETGRVEEALERAAKAAPALSGSLDGAPFDQIRDGDDLVGSVLEVFAGGHYLWVPLERIRKLEIGEPKHRLDLLWISAVLTDADALEAAVYLPVLYEDSHQAAEPRARVGGVTAWEEWRGTGQRVLLTAKGAELRETALLAVRVLALDVGRPKDG